MKLKKTLILCFILMATPGHATDRQIQLPSGGAVYLRDLINDLDEEIKRAHAQELACEQEEGKLHAAQTHVNELLSSLENMMEKKMAYCEIDGQCVNTDYTLYRVQRGEDDLLTQLRTEMNEVLGLYQKWFPSEESEINDIITLPEKTLNESIEKCDCILELARKKLQVQAKEVEETNQGIGKKYSEIKTEVKTLAEIIKQKKVKYQQKVTYAFQWASQANLEIENLEKKKRELVNRQGKSANWTAQQANNEADKACEKIDRETTQWQREKIGLQKFAHWIRTHGDYVARQHKCIQQDLNIWSEKIECKLLEIKNEHEVEEGQATPESLETKRVMILQIQSVRTGKEKAQETIERAKQRSDDCDNLVQNINAIDQCTERQANLLLKEKKGGLTSEDLKQRDVTDAMLEKARTNVGNWTKNYLDRWITRQDAGNSGKVDNITELTKRMEDLNLSAPQNVPEEQKEDLGQEKQLSKSKKKRLQKKKRAAGHLPGQDSTNP